MTLIVISSLPVDGDNAVAANVDDPVNAIVAVVNGNLDDSNIASLSGTKITAGTLPGTSLNAAAKLGWITGLTTPNTVVALGNRSYSLTVSATDLSAMISAGMRLKLTRTAIAPTQCTSLNGTTQYYSKASPNKMTFTDDFVVSAWVKLSSYQAGTIASRYNGTSGWDLEVTASGQVTLIGFNGGGGNFSYVNSYQSVPLNKWVHIAAQLDMSTFTATPTTSYVMIDGVDVPAAVSRGGTNPTALIQAGNLEIGSRNAGTQLLAGKLAQVAIYNAKVTQATILASISQGLAGTETNLASAYSFNNSITDLNTTTPNDLSANGSALATSADSPFGGQANGTISSTIEYGIITKVAFSTDTTITVQVPEGNAIPTTGGIAAVSYSQQKAPFNFPAQEGKWYVEMINKNNCNNPSPTTSIWYNLNSQQINAPLGEWIAILYGTHQINGSSGSNSVDTTLSTGAATESNAQFTTHTEQNATVVLTGVFSRQEPLSVSTPTVLYLNTRVSATAGSASIFVRGDVTVTVIRLKNAYL